MASPSTPTSSRPTPIRAIPSCLAIKTAPTIPPPTETYEPLVKAVLRHRVVCNIFPKSGLLTWAIVVVAILWQQNVASMNIGQILVVPFRPLTVIASSIVWLLMVLPIIVLRKLLLTSTRTPATSPASSLSVALTKPSTRRALLVYAVSALALVVVHAAMASAIEPVDPKLRLFVKSKKHPHYLNGRFLFLLISQLAIALSYGVRNIMLDRFVFKWSIASQKDDATTSVTLFDIIRASTISALLSALALPVAAGVFTLTRMLLPILYRVPVVSALLKPFTAHFLRGSWSILLPLQHIDLVRRAFNLGFMTFFIWEIADTLFDLNVAKQIPVAHLTADPNQTLISAMSSNDTIFRYFAYSELCTFAEDGSPAGVARRTALFSDQKYSPALWARLIRESLLLLGKDYQLFLRRGEPEVPPVAAPPPTKPAPGNAVQASPVPMLRRRIFKSSGEDALDVTLDALASDGPVSQTVDASVNTIELPQIFRSAEVKAVTQVTKEVQKGVESGKGTMGTTRQKLHELASRVYRKYVPPVAAEYLEVCMRWWREDRVNKVAEKCLPSRELDVVIVEVISRLTCASLSEDRYGVVQRDIPRILEAFLSFLSAVEEYQIKVNSLYVAPKPDEKLTPKEIQEREMLGYEVEKAGEVLGAMADGLKEGVARIVRTFGDKLLAFKFPPRTAQKLQGFLDYC